MTTAPGFFDELRQELVAATDRVNQKAQHARRRRRRVLGLALLATLAPVSVAVAALWQPWTENDGLRRLSPTQQVATGVVEGGGTWRLVTFSSSSGPCVELLLEGAADKLPSRAGGCDAPQGSVATISSGAGKPALLFGEVAPAVTRVLYESSQEDGSATDVVPLGSRRFFVLQVNAYDSDACVVSHDATGTTITRANVSSASRRECEKARDDRAVAAP